MQTLYQAFAQAVADAPNAPFLAQPPSLGGRVWRYAEVAAEVDRLSALYARRGWGAGHRIALGVGNAPGHFFHFLALNRLGASIVPMNPDHRGGEIRYQLGHSGAELVVANAERGAATREALAGTAGPPIVAGDRLADDLPTAPPARRAAGDPWRAETAILYTSGTSGLPKGCILTNEYVLTASAWYRDCGGLLALREGQDRVFNPLPVFHMNCGINTLGAMILTRNCLIIPDRFHASTWWADVGGSGATGIHYLGVMPPALIKHPPSPHDRAHAVRWGLGAGCDPTLHAEFEARFGLPLIEVWGMTETGRFLVNHEEPRQVDTRAFGRMRAPLETRVVDDQDRPVAAGQPGELLVRCAGDDPRRGFFSGYLDDPEATERAWRGGWFHTGDIVSVDDSGMHYFIDRRKDMIRRSGENISAGEVEAVLAAHPLVHRVAVMAVPDEMRDEEVLAVVVPSPGVNGDAACAQALTRHCLAELAYYKAPAWVVFRDELPVTSTNKLQKHRIFGRDEDPRASAIDCRGIKKRPGA
ncbi:MAG: AMP-binding protein [Betaproteobacteria bacterium]|nr:AMP-binding protein [Betaproteobacteria bacterium]